MLAQGVTAAPVPLTLRPGAAHQELSPQGDELLVSQGGCATGMMLLAFADGSQTHHGQRNNCPHLYLAES